MKIVGRLSIILVTALVVIGIAISLSHASFGQNMTPARGESVRQQPISVTSNQSNLVNQNNFNGQSPSNDPHSAGGFGILQVVQNFALIGLIVLPFAIAPRFLRDRRTGSPGV